MISKQNCVRALCHADRQVSLQFTRLRLYFVIVRNAGKWHDQEHARDWCGYIQCQAPGQAKRAVKEVKPGVREVPIGQQGAEQGKDVLDGLDDGRLPPDEQAELHELRQLVS